MLIACNDEVNIPDGALEEQEVDLSGLWTVGSVSLNGTNVTERLNFQDLTLKLEMNDSGPSSYEVDNNGAPFIVTQNGSWDFDDRSYPQEIIFNSDPGEESVRFAVPPVSGDVRFTIEFSLGCEDNKYTYQMIRQ